MIVLLIFDHYYYHIMKIDLILFASDVFSFCSRLLTSCYFSLLAWQQRTQSCNSENRVRRNDLLCILIILFPQCKASDSGAVWLGTCRHSSFSVGTLCLVSESRFTSVTYIIHYTARNAFHAHRNATRSNRKLCPSFSPLNRLHTSIFRWDINVFPLFCFSLM